MTQKNTSLYCLCSSFKKLIVLTILILFSIQVKAQCPAGNVSLTSQAEVNAFATNYPNCTEISGYLHIYGSTITDLSPLSNLTSVGGYLQVYNNSYLTNLDGLSSLTSVGGFLQVYVNSNLTNLDGLSNLTSVGADLLIVHNPSLTDISGLQSISPASILSTYGYGLYIAGNTSLSVCNLPNFCEYLAGSGSRTISGNAGDCVSEVAVTTACAPACDAPENLTVSGIINNKATINWTNSGTFDLKWGAENFTDGNELGTANTISALNYQIIGLTENTSYDVYVRQNCGDNQSDWVKVTFSTIAQCPAGDVALTSQAQVNAFATNYPNCTEISGYLYIYGSTITDLSPLSNLTSVGGYLYIGSNSVLTNLDGLSNLTSVGADLIIFNNPSLTDISGLQNIDPTSIFSTYGFGLYVSGNSSLSVCNLPNFCEYLAGSGLRIISDNAGDCVSEAAVATACVPACDAPTNLTATNITSVSATLGWTSAGNNFDIEWGTQGFTQGSGTMVTDIATNSYNLTSLSSNTQYQFYVRQDCSVNESDWTGPFGFTTLSQCPAGDVALASQAQVNAFATNYPNCTEISGNLYIYGNDITDLSPLSNLTSVGGFLNINYNSSLTNLDGLSNLTSVGGYLHIGSNSGLTNLDGLSNLTSVGSFLDIYGNYNLTNLDGLSSLTSVGGFLQVYVNSNLTNLDGLSNLTSIGADLLIESNSSLTDISGLQNIDPSSILSTYEMGLYIANNTSLSVCNLPNFCEYLAGSGLRTISGNAGDCVSEAVVATACLAFCETPTSVSASNIIADKATISWTSTGTSFELQWGVEGFELGQGSMATVTSTLYEITQLTALTNYDVYVRQNCIDSDSEWIKHTFSTISICPTVDIVFSNQQEVDDFGINYPNCTILQVDLSILNSDVSNLNGLSNLTQIQGNLIIDYNTQLNNLNGLNNLTHVAENLVFGFNTGLNNFQGLDNLTQIGATLDISYNSITNLEGLSNLTSIGGDLSLLDNQNLANLDGLSNLTSIGGGLRFFTNPQLTNLDGLSNMTSIGGYLQLYTNQNLTNLDGLSDLTSIGGYLLIYNNQNLTNLDGLSNLTSIGGDLVIMDNQSLTDISGLQNIDPTSISSTNELGLHISENPLLSVCNLPNFCEYLSGSGLRTIFGNADDCISDQAVLNACEMSGGCDSYTIWNGTTWSNGLPDTTKKAIIEGDLTITDDLSACELKLNAGILTIASGVSFTVNGVIENTQTEANFIVENDANLIQIDDIDNIGAITVVKSKTMKHLDYTIWSSPVLEQKLKSFSPHTLNNRIRIYDTTDDTWKVISNPETTDFASGAGYMFRAPNADDNPGTPYLWTGNFIGLPQNGDVIYNFDNTYGTGVYQSIGNPYPSNISYSSLVATNPEIGTVYFWTNSTAPAGGEYTTNNWAAYSSAGAVPSDNVSLESNGIISVGQGFVAETSGSITEVTFNNQMRTASEGVFFRTITEDKHRLWLDLKKEDLKLNQILIGYMPDASNEFDFGVDAKLFNYSGSALYSLIDNNEEQFVIQGRALPFTDSDIVPLGFRATTAGSFNISLSNFDGDFAAGQDIFLKDIYANTTHNLKNGDYWFVSEAGTFENRFEVVYRQGNMSIENPTLENSWVVYKQDNAFQIQTQGFEMKDVIVYDTLGRVVYSSKVSGNNHSVSYLGATQMLIVKITTTDNVVLIRKVK